MNVQSLMLNLFVVAMLSYPASAQPKPSSYDLVGHWESTVEFGKFKFDLTIKVAKLPDGRLEVKVDLPEQGARDVPVSAMLVNYPAVRWEIDPFNTAFNGSINPAGNEIAGMFDEGPGGRPIPLTFRRVDPSQKSEKSRSYDFAKGEAVDIRGFWEATAETEPNTPSRLGLKIGRAGDGSFVADLDLLDQGTRSLPSSPAVITNAITKLEWKLFQFTFTGKLSADGNSLEGEWKARGKKLPVRFQRLSQPAELLPANVSFIPASGVPGDIRGEWNGLLSVPGNKLRLIVKIGRTPDGIFAGTLASPDQGGAELPITSVGYTNPVVRIEWKGIHGVFTGKVNPEGTVLDGTWEQGGPPLALKLDRSSMPAKQP